MDAYKRKVRRARVQAGIHGWRAHAYACWVTLDELVLGHLLPPRRPVTHN